MSESVDFRGLPAIRWRSADGATAVATLQGAHVVSWCPARGAECLYVSERSPFEAGRAIRGGIPVVFPQFADRGPLPQHGFARTQAWRFAGSMESEEGCVATFVLDASDTTHATWPHAFRLELAVSIGGAGIATRLRVANVGDTSFTFSAALHTYLRISGIDRARLEGLDGVRYLTRGESAAGREERAAIPANEPIDRIYFAAPSATRLHDAGRTLRIGQGGFTDTVVWNPGAERAARMADMPPDGYRHMFCVEAAVVDPPVVLPPDAAWSGIQAIVAEPIA